MGFTVEFAVFPIAQIRVFAVGFSSYTQLPLYLACALVPRSSSWGKQRSRDGERGWTKIAQGPAVSLEISWRVSCPRLEADPISNSAEVQAECGCSFAPSLIQQNREKSKRTFYGKY